MMRAITHVVFHCSATPEGRVVTAKDIDAMHKVRGFKRDARLVKAGELRHIGYHYFVRLDGTVEKGRPEAEPGAHVAGHNSRSIGICYAGGIDKAGKSKDTRTAAQKAALRELSNAMRKKYPRAVQLGHRDMSPDKDGDGVVERHEWLKDCPCFDAKAEYGVLAVAA